ncbi:MAG TPA: hypothetical protein VK045_04100, partial [Ornithinicoccus sp.]|nr:hypothetical protein [Ornithinicoccus sp.]
ALNRSRRTCWTGLVCWVEYGSPLRASFDTTRCLDDGWCEGKQCYCGKFGQCPESVSTDVEVAQ